MEEEIRKELREKLEPDVRRELEEEVRKDLREELEPEVRRKLEEEIRQAKKAQSMNIELKKRAAAMLPGDAAQRVRLTMLEKQKNNLIAVTKFQKSKITQKKEDDSEPDVELEDEESSDGEIT